MREPATAGYSGSPLPRKLGIKENHRVALMAAPDGFESSLSALPRDVCVVSGLRAKGPFDVILMFCRKRTDLVRNFEKARRRLSISGGLWIAWPKKASGVETDLSDSVVRAFGLDSGLVDNKVCAIDATWSGLRFVVRLKDRK
ncbi:MAG TPA: DUF3052 domain-containing protein [Phycisphaerae bacterium]|nr:DUF3052 domain-containing protein [Phycisphaerae bacterium]HRW54373.1 DUF3052 domain-containing protein [Phycisphaerae bacterium]